MSSRVTEERRGWLVAVALCMPLLVLLAVAGITWRAEQRYARVTQRVVHDYASIAAWQYARAADSALHDPIMAAFGPVSKTHQRTARASALLPPAALLNRDPGAPPSALRAAARIAFTYDATTDSLQIAGADGDEATRRLIHDRLRAFAQSSPKDAEPHRVLFDRAANQGIALVLWTLPTGMGERGIRGAYGYVVSPNVFARVFGKVVTTANLLPGTTLTRKLGPDDLAIRVTQRNGSTVFATSARLTRTAAIDSTGLQDGDLRVALDLAPHVANALLVGGAPASQLPLLLVLIVLAAALAGIGLVHDRRTRELARVRSRFVANVSHELRTPLAQISMFAETLHLGRERSAAEGRHFAAIILAEARRLTNLVEGVLRYSRHERGQPALQRELVDVTQEIADSVDAFAPIAHAADVTVTRSGAEAWADVERAAIRQIVLNLLDNAVKHGGRGSAIDVRTRIDDAELRIEVDDAGPGIPAAWRERVFEPFTRVEGRKVAGAGIGLSVVRELVLAHGGRVWIEDSPRGGARVVVALPAAPPTAPHRVAPAERLVATP
jgi:signal transduction histidine kinase